VRFYGLVAHLLYWLRLVATRNYHLTVVALLAGRQIAIMILAIIAPLAIIAWIFPANTTLWKIWQKSFMKLLLLYPLIMVQSVPGNCLRLS
jgi:hypothetical protein